MIIPPILSAAAIREIPTRDTHAVRILVLTSAAGSKFTLRGTGRLKAKYLLDRDGETGRHVLDIPVSIWNHGIPEGRYHDNPSIAHDLLSKPNPLVPFITKIVPWNGAAAENPVAIPDAALADVVETISLRLLAITCEEEFKLFATPEITATLERECRTQVLAFLESAGRDDVVKFIRELTPDLEPPAPQPEPAAAAPQAPADGPSQTPAAIRMREMRARKKAEKQAAKDAAKDAAKQPA